jgi:hypothetical protein
VKGIIMNDRSKQTEQGHKGGISSKEQEEIERYTPPTELMGYGGEAEYEAPPEERTPEEMTDEERRGREPDTGPKAAGGTSRTGGSGAIGGAEGSGGVGSGGSVGGTGTDPKKVP